MNRNGIFTYPDGTQGTRRPKDGEVFWTTDNTSGDYIEWQWDDYKQQWFRKNKNPSKLFENQYEKLDLSKITEYSLSGSDIRCECGSEKCGSNKHSSWCPKHV